MREKRDREGEIEESEGRYEKDGKEIEKNREMGIAAKVSGE